jgi:hypothetical protein
VRLRTMALVAGALGLLVLAVGLVADATRSEAVATPMATLETSVVVVGPEILALAPDGRVSVTGSGTLIANAARPVDAQAWVAGQSVTYLTGLPDWETLGVRTSDRVEPQEPLATKTPAATPVPTPEPTPEPTVAADDASEADAFAVPLLSEDHWRATWNGDDSLSVAVSDIPVGMPLVVRSADGSVLTDVSMRMERDLNDGWISPLIWWGIVLTAVGLIALLFLLVDLRPVQERTETWLAHRRRGARAAASVPSPGSRRARRATGDAIPVAEVELDPTTPKDSDAHPTHVASTKEERS